MNPRQSKAMSSDDPSRFKYDVFISHRTGMEPDRTAAMTLQKVLERYPVPWSLRKNIANPRLLGSRLWVFRDITDFSAASNLDDAVREKLKMSRWLDARDERRKAEDFRTTRGLQTCR
jgi:hypothetical protein